MNDMNPVPRMPLADRYPLSAQYGLRWAAENAMGPNALWLMEWLCRGMDLKPGMRVLDMGCGKAMTSIFLAKEFGVQVWANDLWIPATDNWERIRATGVEDKVFPIHAEAHALPYAAGFFDAIVCVDAYHYFGTDDLYQQYILSFLKPGGQMGFVVPATMQEVDENVPDHLEKTGFWDRKECFSLHTLEYWRRLWSQTRLAKIETADTLEDGWREWLVWYETWEAHARDTLPSPDWLTGEMEGLRQDQGRYIGFVRLIARTPA